MKQWVVVAFWALLAPWATMAAQTASPQIPKQTLQVQVNLVTVPVTVTDSKGRSVVGLSQKDFTLTEDGRRQSIRVFQSSAIQPISVVLAIDTSLSVRSDLPAAKQAAYSFADSILRPGDQLELIGFAGKVTRIVPFTGNLRLFRRGLQRLRGEGPTALYAAVVQAAKDLQPVSGRKVIVVISDGSNSISGVDYEQARSEALRTQASVESMILVPIAASAGRDLGGEHALIQLSRDTGGQFFYADAADKLRDALSQLSLALRSEYLLGYYPSAIEDNIPPDNGFRHIEVQMTSPALKRRYRLRYRTGYYAWPNR